MVAGTTPVVRPTHDLALVLRELSRVHEVQSACHDGFLPGVASHWTDYEVSPGRLTVYLTLANDVLPMGATWRQNGVAIVAVLADARRVEAAIGGRAAYLATYELSVEV